MPSVRPTSRFTFTTITFLRLHETRIGWPEVGRRGWVVLTKDTVSGDFTAFFLHGRKRAKRGGHQKVAVVF
jgi:hypothetical protein